MVRADSEGLVSENDGDILREPNSAIVRSLERAWM